jgi:hypothetical protein
MLKPTQSACFGLNSIRLKSVLSGLYFLVFTTTVNLSGSAVREALTRKVKQVISLKSHFFNHFELSTGKRVLKEDINNNGIGVPVYSANVFEPFGSIDKELISDFSVSSVLWGIDGDWLVNYVSENEPFYPTDYCGVLEQKPRK